ncbi:MAG: phosphoglucomutase/phosphomannomutase family protein [candidate division WOR-3 bacterium]
MPKDIVFGTDGWRGIIADTATFRNYERIAQATSIFVKDNWPYEKGVFIGYDTRFFSELFAKRVAEVFAGNGIKVILADRFVPTPFVTFAIKHYGYGFGVAITASHNPYQYNGYKLRTPLGGACGKEYTDVIEELVDIEPTRLMDFEEAVKRGLIEIKNIYPDYINWVSSKVDINAIVRSNFKVISDPMYGATMDLMRIILAYYGMDVELINSTRNPFFDFRHPEPIEKNVQDLIAIVKTRKAHIGIATDGDGDRVGLVDDKGRFISPHKIYALILTHLAKNKGIVGKIAKTVSTTSLLDSIAQRIGIEVVETAVGFKYMAEMLAKKEIVIGGEESGGIGVCFHIPERDGLFSALLVLEYMAVEGKLLSELVDELEKEYGPYYYRRLDIPVKDIFFAKDVVRKLKENPPSVIKGMKVSRVNDVDGIKLVIDDGSWILFRASGTEPLLRVYVESQSEKLLEDLVSYGREKAAGL